MYEGAGNEGRLDVIDEVCGPDYVGVGPYGNELVPELVKRGVTSCREAVPDIHVTIEDVITEGDKVVARLTFRGTHKGRISGHSTHEPRGRVDRYVVNLIFDRNRRPDPFKLVWESSLKSDCVSVNDSDHIGGR